eukprot:3332620-Pleurochrysis_carterae.AAC.1
MMHVFAACSCGPSALTKCTARSPLEPSLPILLGDAACAVRRAKGIKRMAFATAEIEMHNCRS